MANDTAFMLSLSRRRALMGLAGLAVPFAGTPAWSQGNGLVGRWEGVANLPGDVMAFSVTFTQGTSGALTGHVSIADAGVFQLRLNDVSMNGGRVRFGIPFGASSSIPFEGEIRGLTISGSFRMGEASAPVSLVRQQSSAPPYTEEAVTIVNGDVRLQGALLIPAGPGPHPAILFQHSGRPETREPWLYWADHFARNGIAGLVYDNRRSGGPRNTPWVDFADVASDALAAIRMLKRRRDINRRGIGLFAVSQGGWIAPMVAARDPAIAFVAMVSPAALPQRETVLYEARREMEAAGLPPAEVSAGVAAKQRFERMILDGASDDALDAFRASVQDRPWFSMIGLLPRGHWHRGWWRRNGGGNPAALWRRVQAPVLAYYGDQDVELPVQETVAALRSAYAPGGRRTLTTRVFVGADHSLRVTRGLRSVRAPQVMPDLLSWIRAQVRRAS